MTELPDRWVETTLGDITADSAQRVPATDEQFQYVDIASIDRLIKRITSPQLLWGHDAPSRARKEIKAGDVLVSMTRPNLNAVALVPPEFDRQIASTGFDVLRSIGVEPRWLCYVVRAQAFIDRMSELVQGALYPAVRSKDVRGYVAPLAPLNEQKRIADKLDAILARVFEDDYLAIPSAYLIRFRFSPRVLTRYVFYCLMAPAGQERLGLSATAITQPNVNAEAIKRIESQLPSIDEQYEIVRRVEALFAYADRVEARYTDARTQVERLTPALLAEAFRGELVPQDPNDEPASVLLERIWASHAAAGEKPTRKARTERKPMATTLTTNTLKEIIRGLPTDQFTFDDLRGHVATDYETLKDMVFALLSEAPASIKQVFDTEVKTMRLVRVK